MAIKFLALSAATAILSANAQLIATNPQGATNPPRAIENTPINQTSEARLLSLNSASDFCLFAGFGSNQPIGNIEGEVVAWCTKPRNNARVIPDGTITAVHFYKAPSYVQVRGYGDMTKIGLVDGDYGGELDPHGAYGLGNPVGGNVTSNVSGQDVSYEEWMQFIGYNTFCLRVCTSDKFFSPSLMCEHELDVMGCDFVMPGSHEDNVFEECESNDPSPPGLYINNGVTSTFRQYFTGVYTANGAAVGYTVGDLTTPAAPQFTPASSNCKSLPSISNGLTALVTQASNASTTSGSQTASGSAASVTGSGSSRATNSGSSTSRSTSSVRSTASSTESAAASQYVTASWVLMATLAIAPLAVLFATY